MGERGRRGSRGQPGIKGDAGDLGPPGLKGQKGEPSLSSTTTPRRSPAARVAFSVARSQKLGPVLEDTLVRFDVVYTNVGDGFDLSASRFVCRTNGTYTFTAHLLGQNNKDVYAWIMMNDKHKVCVIWPVKPCLSRLGPEEVCRKIKQKHRYFITYYKTMPSSSQQSAFDCTLNTQYRILS